MLQILGIGASRPETVIENSFFDNVQSSVRFDQRSPIKKRHSVLPISYIQDLENRDPLESKKSSLINPTELAKTAALEAISSAGIAKEEIGLIIADCSTPDEVTPSEAQRIARALELKVPAYDWVASTPSICLSLYNLLRWKEDKIPDYILWVSTNTTSQWLDYSSDEGALLFGDAASALVISTKGQGLFRVLGADFNIGNPSFKGFEIGLRSTLKFDELATKTALNAKIVDYINTMSGSMDHTYNHSILNPLLYHCLETSEINFKDNSTNYLNSTWEHADTLGASAGEILHQNLEAIPSGDSLMITLAGPGLSLGSLMLIKN